MDVLVNGEIVLHGTVGQIYWEEGFTARDVIEALAALGRDKDVTVHINSGGGVAWEGVAIYNALDSHRGKVTCVVDGIAASAASIIAMAGDETVMAAGSLMMIHDPALFTMGDAADHKKSIEVLDKLGDQLAGIYADKTGSSTDALRELMRAETWLTADEAVSLKFADRSDQAAAAEAMAFNYGAYQQTPDTLRALAAERNWNKKPEASTPAPKLEAEPAADVEAPAPVADPAPAPAPVVAAEQAAPATVPAPVASGDLRQAERQRIASIMNSAEAKGREALAEYFAYDTDWTPETAIAALTKAPKAAAAAPKEITLPAPAATIAGLELDAPVSPVAKKAAVINPAEIYNSRR